MERRSVPRPGAGGGIRYVIPQVSLLELIRLEGDTGKRQIERIHETPFYRRRGSLLPLVYLADVLQLGGPLETNVVNIVVLQAEDRQFGLVVDGISDTQEIVVKPLGKQLKGLNCYAGATIMGDGRVALILDVSGIAQLSGVVQESREKTTAEAQRREYAGSERQTFLLFRAGSVRAPGGSALARGAAGGNQPLQDRARRRQARGAVSWAHPAAGLSGAYPGFRIGGYGRSAGSRAGGGLQ